MLQLPNVVGLTLCEQIVTDATTHNLTLVNTFTRLRCSTFPSPPQRFVVCAALTDGQGDGTMSLAVSRLDTLEIIDRRHWQIRFTDPLRVVRLIVRLRNLSLPVPGGYQLSLSADGEWLAQTVLRVNS
jgi:hypothetical protein